MTAHTAHLLPLGSHPVGCSAVPRAPTLRLDVPRRSPLKAKLAVSLAVGAAPVCALTRVCLPGWSARCPEDLHSVSLSLRESSGALYGRATLLGLPSLTSLQSVWSAPKRAGKAQPVTEAGDAAHSNSPNPCPETRGSSEATQELV